MGTSQSHNLKSTPNWSSAKRAMTSIINGTGNSSINKAKFISYLGSAMDNNMYRGARGRNQRASFHGQFGLAGGRAMINLISFISNIRENGLSSTLSLWGLSEDDRPETLREFMDLLLKKIMDENDSTIDDAAAEYALDQLLNELLEECNDMQEIEDRFREATDDEIHSWIINYEINYILEYSAELFQSHIFDKGGNPESIKEEIRSWLHNELDERLGEKLSHHDLNSPEGKEFLDTLTFEIINIWRQE